MSKDDAPQLTRMEWFMQEFPNCRMVLPQYIPATCVLTLTEKIKCPLSEGHGCVYCWHEPYKKEDFE